MKEAGMTLFGTTLAIVVFLAPIPTHSAAAGPDPPTGPLDGKSFEGRIRFTGLFFLLRGKMTVEFNDGVLSWSGDEMFEPARYETTTEDEGSIAFTARAIGKEDNGFVDDYAVWSGVYDGASLSDVKLVWTRKKGGGSNRVYDWMFPEVVTLVFNPN
jgi:hypothetical protein